MEKKVTLLRQHATRNIRLPGFIIQEEIGLGDIIKRMTYKMGIEPCNSCEKRAELLNRHFVFSPKKSSL